MLTNTGWVIPLVQSSLKTLVFKRYDACNIAWQLDDPITHCYKIIHKSGDLDVLQGTDRGGDLKLPLLMINEAGLALTFDWNGTDLNQVLDDTKTSLMTTASSMSTFTFFPNTPESYEADLVYKTADQLTSVAISPGPDQDAGLTWTLEYGSYDGDNDWPGWLTGLIMPGGATERVQYAPTHGFPATSNLPALPAVQTYTQDPGGGQPPITTTFMYTSNESDSDMAGKNFLAGGTAINNWVNNRDNLYDYEGAYAYGSTETCGTRVTTRIYNKFHLLTQEAVTEGDGDDAKTVVTTTSYYVQDSLPFDQLQLAFFQLHYAKTVTWVNGVDPVNDPHYAETTQYGSGQTDVDGMFIGPFGWDDYGNPLQKTDPNGLFKQWSYYDGSKDTYDGSALLCPADPNGFTRFAAWTRVDPSGVSGAFIVPGAPLQQIDYTYARATPAAIMSTQPYVNGLVMHKSASHTSGGTVSGSQLVGGMVLGNTAYSYDTGGHLDAGRLTTQISTHYPKGKSNGTSFKRTETFTYAPSTFAFDTAPADISILVTTKTVKADDPDIQAGSSNDHPAGYLQVQSASAASIFSGRPQWEADTLGNVTHYLYDYLGRATKRTLNATGQEDYSNTFTYAYAIAGTLLGDGQTYPFQVTKEDPNHNVVCYTLDGLHRVMRHDVNAVDVPNGRTAWWTMETRDYDEMGRLANHVVFDYDVDPATGSTTNTYQLATTAITYDNWGQTQQITYNDNTADVAVYDPVAKTHSSTRLGLSADGQTITQNTFWSVTTLDYNTSKKPIKVERRYGAPTPDAAKPYSARTRQYNGLYWAISDTDELSRTTTYAHDAWGRVTDTTLPDKTNTTPATVVHRDYCPKSPAALVGSISVNGWLTGQGKARAGACLIGTREFDSLGRVMTKTVGGSTWAYQYRYNGTTKTDVGTRVYDGYAHPIAAAAPDGYTREYEYVYELGEVLRTASVKNHTTHKYDYNHVTGSITTANANVTGEAAAGTSLLTYSPFPSGRLRGETIGYPDFSPRAGETGTSRATLEKQTAYTYTIGGAMRTYVHVDGATTTLARDPQGRIQSVSDGAVTATPQYDPAGRLTGWSALDTGSNRTLKTTWQLDDFGRETQRTISDGTDTWTITQDSSMWTKNDLLTQRHVSRNGGAVRYAIYTYDARNRLIVWDTENIANNLPPACDRFGNVLWKQTFTLDALNNITSVVTKFRGGVPSNTTQFTFDYTQDPCRVLGGTNSNTQAGPATFTVQYDKAGRITDDGQGTTFKYDPLGRVSEAASTLTGLEGTYRYDALNRQSVTTSSDTANPLTYFYYRSNELVNLAQGDSNNIRLLRSLSGEPVAQYNSGGEQAGAWLLGVDRLGSVLNASNGKASDLEQWAYSAYGEKPVPKS